MVDQFISGNVEPEGDAYLVTGSHGHIGSYIVEELCKQKDDIIAIKDIDGNLLQITDKGLSYLTNLYHQLQIAFEKHSFLFEGTVFSGLGEGAYYVSLSGYKKQFISKLNFEPFPGTLNLRLINPIYRKMKLRLSNSSGIHINGFTDKKRTFGSAKCFPALINNKENGAVLVIERTHYDNSVLELISTVNLRKKLQLKDGHSVTVNVL
mgnify:CR=1 FL=1